MNKISKSAFICNDVILGDNVNIGDNVYIDHRVIIRDNVTIKDNCTIGANCILGEYQVDFYNDRNKGVHPLTIGDNSIIRSGCIIYGDTEIGSNFMTGHNVTIREKTYIGKNCSIGTLSDIQGNCEIRDYVRIHSNVFISQGAKIEDYVWIFPHVVLTDDPTPPSMKMSPVVIKKFAIICARSILLPGTIIEEDSLVAAGAVVTKNVNRYDVVAGNPAKIIGDIRNIKNHITGENAYPWRYHFKKYMPWEILGYNDWKKENKI